jgi:hypothetical protein
MLRGEGLTVARSARSGLWLVVVPDGSYRACPTSAHIWHRPGVQSIQSAPEGRDQAHWAGTGRRARELMNSTRSRFPSQVSTQSDLTAFHRLDLRPCLLRKTASTSVSRGASCVAVAASCLATACGQESSRDRRPYGPTASIRARDSARAGVDHCPAGCRVCGIAGRGGRPMADLRRFAAVLMYREGSFRLLPDGFLGSTASGGNSGCRKNAKVLICRESGMPEEGLEPPTRGL